jgi:hypothetical protein
MDPGWSGIRKLSTWPGSRQTADVAQSFTAKVSCHGLPKSLTKRSPKVRQWLAFRLTSIILPKALPFGKVSPLRFFATSAFDVELDGPFLGCCDTSNARKAPRPAWVPLYVHRRQA